MKKIFAACAILLVLLACLATLHFINKYRKASIMMIPIEELGSSEYPEDPSDRSVYYDSYGDRVLKLVQLDDTHFDFVFESNDPAVAIISIKGVDVGLYVPIAPTWTKNNRNNEAIAIIDREWNRQQVSFPLNSSQIEILGGDGFERDNLYSIELARNCLNAGLWEVLFYTLEDGKKSLYYQGWFQFPLGHYKNIFEKKNDISYWNYWSKLEYWNDPEGTHVDLTKLRDVEDEFEVKVIHNLQNKLIVAGEQLRKMRTLNAKNVRCFGDFYLSDKLVSFARFLPPGCYNAKHLQKSKLNRLAKVEHVYVRKVRTPPYGKLLDEIEVVFSDDNGETNSFFVSGVNLQKLPILSVNRYPEGLYMPMGIAVPPFNQSYLDLRNNPPHETSFFSLLLNSKDQWVNHHDLGIDGPVMHRDTKDPNLVHLYLLSYERYALVGHYILPLGDIIDHKVTRNSR